MPDIYANNQVDDAQSEDEKKKALFEQQKRLLNAFLERNAISQKDYEKSLSVLSEHFKEFL